tara:strand:+ start:12614 stop:13096 length:483 start_codon:yes stop_codon:yes gene_type:complete
MIRLTSRAWNNVLIVSMLLLIIIFNLSGNFFSGGSNDNTMLARLIPSGATITSIETESITIERVGRGWRLLPGRLGVDNQVLSEAVAHWQQATLEPVAQGPINGAVTVDVWLAGEGQPRRYLFFQVGADMLVQYPALGGQSYKVTEMSWQQLFITDIPHA